MTNFNDVLNTKPFEGAVVIAGKEGLSNLVKTITVAELQDAADWLSGGEIVCTSGFLIKNQSESQVLKWVKGLVEKKAAALAIKISRFIGEVPEQVKIYANSNNFPIIGIPNDVTWPNLIEAVIDLINSKNIVQLQRAMEIQVQLTQLVLNGNDVSQITQVLSDIVCNPIIVEDGRLNLMTTAIPSVSEVEEKEYSQANIKLRTNDGFKKKIINSGFYRNVLLHRKKEILKIPLSKPNKSNTVTIPILASNIVYGFLTLIEVRKELITSDIVAIEHGANAIALKLVNDSTKSKSQTQKEQEEIQKFINGGLYPSTLGNHYLPPIDWSSPMVVVLIQSFFEDIDEGLFVINHPKQTFEKIIKENIRKVFRECVLAYEKNLFTLFVPLKGSQTKVLLLELNHTLENCKFTLSNLFPSHKTNIAIGSVYSSKTKLKKSYEDAQKTLEIMQIIPTSGPIASFEMIGITRLIHKIEDYEFLRNFKDDYLSELLEHDNKNGDILCDTLRTFLQVGGNVTVAAKELYVHPNTITYRIRKIKAIIGNPLQNSQYRDSLLFALEINNYLNTLEK